MTCLSELFPSHTENSLISPLDFLHFKGIDGFEQVAQFAEPIGSMVEGALIGDVCSDRSEGGPAVVVGGGINRTSQGVH